MRALPVRRWQRSLLSLTPPFRSWLTSKLLCPRLSRICIVHAYPEGIGPVTLTAALYEGGMVRITVTDRGVGIADVEKAMQPMYTTGDPEKNAPDQVLP